MSLYNFNYILIIFFILQCNIYIRNWMSLPVSVPEMKTKTLQREAIAINHLSIGWKGREAQPVCPLSLHLAGPLCVFSF